LFKFNESLLNLVQSLILWSSVAAIFSSFSNFFR